MVQMFFMSRSMSHLIAILFFLPPTRNAARRQGTNKRERSAPQWRLSREANQSQGPSQQSRQGAQVLRVHVHPCCRLQPGRLSPEPQTHDAPREKHAAQAGDLARAAGYGQQISGQILQSEVEQGGVGGPRVVLLEYGEDVEGKLTGEREGELVKRRQTGPAPRSRGQSVTAHRCPCCARHRQKRYRCSKPTSNGARGLDTKSRATSSVWCGVAPDGSACPACVALLRRRVRYASD